MARIRTVKPEFFTHEDLYIAECEEKLPLRVAFSGLWTVCDREGRFKWRPNTIKLAVLPFDDVDFSRVLDALASRGFIEQYATETGELFGFVPSFLEHQVINNRESQSLIPSPFDACCTRDPRGLSMHMGKGKEGKGKERKEKEPTSAKSAISIQAFLENCDAVQERRIPETDPVFDYAESVGIPIDMVKVCWNHFVETHQQNKKRQKDWRSTFRNCVKGNWYKLWFVEADGTVKETSQYRALKKGQKDV